MNISVIIPVYNRATMVKRAIESVIKQTLVPLETIVINDGSTDETNLILNNFKKKLVVFNQENKGVAAARNLGITNAKGEWIAFLDSDDEWLPDKLQNDILFHYKNPHYRIFQSEEIWIRHGKRVNPKNKHQKYGGWIFNKCLPLCIVSPSAVIVEKKLFNEVGSFDTQFTVCEDYDLWLRISRYVEIGLNPQPGIIKYGGHPDQLSRKFWGMDLYRVMAMEKQLSDPLLSEIQRIWVLEEITKKLVILLSGYKKRNRDYSELAEKLSRYNEELISLRT